MNSHCAAMVVARWTSQCYFPFILSYLVSNGFDNLVVYLLSMIQISRCIGHWHDKVLGMKEEKGHKNRSCEYELYDICIGCAESWGYSFLSLDWVVIGGPYQTLVLHKQNPWIVEILTYCEIENLIPNQILNHPNQIVLWINSAKMENQWMPKRNFVKF